MPQIVTLTLNPAVDKISSVQRIVAERKLRCGQPRYDPGGGGLNVARAIRTLGGQATAYWTCGGPMGQLLAERLDTDGVPHRPIPVEAMTRENLLVLEQSTEQQFRFGTQETDISDAVRLGVAAGSAAVMTEGTELCRQEDAWRLYEKMSRSTERL